VAVAVAVDVRFANRLCRAGDGALPRAVGGARGEGLTRLVEEPIGGQRDAVPLDVVVDRVVPVVRRDGRADARWTVHGGASARVLRRRDGGGGAVVAGGAPTGRRVARDQRVVVAGDVDGAVRAARRVRQTQRVAEDTCGRTHGETQQRDTVRHTAARHSSETQQSAGYLGDRAGAARSPRGSSGPADTPPCSTRRGDPTSRRSGRRDTVAVARTSSSAGRSGPGHSGRSSGTS
jgi:hypothetical protein